PFDGVKAVIGFMLERVPFALGGVASANVLDDDDISLRGCAQAESDSPILVVRRALEEDRKFAVGVGAVNICLKFCSIAHGDHDIALHGDRVGVSGECSSSKYKNDEWYEY